MTQADDPREARRAKLLRRRAYLGGVAGLAGVLAGCQDAREASPTPTPEDDAETPTPTSTPTPMPQLSAVTSSAETVGQTETLTVAATVRNRGGGTFDGRVVVGFDETSSAQQTVDLPADTRTEVRVELEPLRVGDREVTVALQGSDGTAVDAASRSVTVEQRPASFVERSGTDFVVDGDSFVYSGLNATLSQHWQGVDWVNRAMSVAADLGVTSIRTWGFPGGYRPAEVHLGPGEFDDTWLEFFDHVVVAAKRNGVRLVLPLLMNWYGPDLAPSPAAYADWSSTADGHNSFFGDETANEYWAEYVEHVLTYTNHLTGVEYRNDPTIMMWEVGNEIEYLDERRGESLATWYDGAARRIKSLDDAHLVGSGMHGATGDVYERWNVRNAFVETHQSDAIDACSFHDYPVVPDGDGQPRVETRDEYFGVATEAANASGLTGVNFWRLAWDSRDHERAPADPRKPLVIHPDDESTGNIIEGYAAAARRRAAGDG